MNIILGFPMQDLQTGCYIKEAFEELGHKVVAINDPRTFPGPNQILDLVDTHKPDFVFLAKDVRYNEIIETLAKKVLTVMWNVDVRDDINTFLDSNGPMYEYCHLKFTIGKGNLDKYREVGIKNIHWLSEGISPIWHRSESLVYKDLFEYTADAAFAGSDLGVHSGRCAVLNALENGPFDFIRYTNVFNREHNKMCQCTKVNIGHSGWPKVELSMSARDYRIMGAGGFLLTNYVEGMENWFEIGKMCDVYRSPEECLEKIKYYLEHEDERKAMAEYGQKVVHEKHKFSDRLKEVIEKVAAYNDLREYWRGHHANANHHLLSGYTGTATWNNLKVADKIVAGSHILEIGVGLGYSVREMASKSVKVSVMDIVPEAFECVKDVVEATYLAGELDKLPKNYFDLVISHNTSCHQSDNALREQIKAVVQSLKPAGIFALGVAGKGLKPWSNDFEPKSEIEILEAGAKTRSEEKIKQVVSDAGGCTIFVGSPLGNVNPKNVYIYSYTVHIKKVI